MDAHWGSEKPPIHPLAESRTFVGETPSLDPGPLEDPRLHDEYCSGGRISRLWSLSSLFRPLDRHEKVKHDRYGSAIPNQYDRTVGSDGPRAAGRRARDEKIS